MGSFAPRHAEAPAQIVLIDQRQVNRWVWHLPNNQARQHGDAKPSSNKSDDELWLSAARSFARLESSLATGIFYDLV